jgi:hypothetical protein
MDEATIKIEARLAAIEHMLVNSFAILYRATGTSPDVIKIIHENARSTLSQTTFPGLDPAQSDLAAGEIQDAVDGLIQMIEETVGVAKTGK